MTQNNHRLIRGCVAAILMASCVVGAAAAEQRTSKADDGGRADQLLSQPERLSAEEIRLLVSRFDTVPNQHDVVNALRENGSEQARSILLGVALEQKQSLDRRWAASSYVATLKDKRQATGLLVADNWEIQEIGLQGLQGQTVDAQLLDAIRPFFQSDHSRLRLAAAFACQESPESSLASEMAAQIVASLRSLDQCKDAAQQVGYGIEGTWKVSVSQLVTAKMIRALAELRGLDLPLLRGLQPDSPETARDAVYLARARRGDRDVKPELMRIARQAPLPLLRVEAVMSFMVIGTVRDLSFLDEISRIDPFDVQWSAQELEVFKNPNLPERKYPVRIAALEVMAQIGRNQ